MKFDIATGILTSLLMTVDPVLAARQKKQRVTGGLDEMEDDTNKHEFHQKKELHNDKKRDVHYSQDGRKKKDRMVNGEHLVEQQNVGISNKLAPVHDNKLLTVSSHQTKQDRNPEIDTDESQLSFPDVGILASDTNITEVERHLHRRRKKRAQKKGPTSCFTEIPIILRNKKTAGEVVFTQPYCEEEYGPMCYWDIKDGHSFFYAGYCDCKVECPKASMSHCCAKGCLQCKNAKLSKCGQFTKTSF